MSDGAHFGIDCHGWETLPNDYTRPLNLGYPAFDLIAL